MSNLGREGDDAVLVIVAEVTGVSLIIALLEGVAVKAVVADVVVGREGDGDDDLTNNAVARRGVLTRRCALRNLVATSARCTDVSLRILFKSIQKSH